MRAAIFRGLVMAVLVSAVCGPVCLARAQAAKAVAAPAEKVILDTDIGDDIDDAFALALLLANPRMQVLGVTTAWGDTDLRARLTARFLADTGHAGIPVAAGPATKTSTVFSQRAYAEAYPAKAWPNAVNFILEQIRRYPGQITLISIAPLSTVGAVIAADPATFRKLKRVVIMGGSIHRGYGDLGYLPDRGPTPEYNILSDVASARRLFNAGVPLEVMPLDSTQMKLDEVLRATLFKQRTKTTDALASLYGEWTAAMKDPTPTLYDPVAVAEAMDPSQCPTTPMHIRIDDRGNTIETAGAGNAKVCLQSDSDRFFHFYFRTVLAAEWRQKH